MQPSLTVKNKEQNFQEVYWHMCEQGLLQQGPTQGCRKFPSALQVVGRAAPSPLW